MAICREILRAMPAEFRAPEGAPCQARKFASNSPIMDNLSVILYARNVYQVSILSLAELFDNISDED